MKRRGPRSNADFELLIQAIAKIKGHRRLAYVRRTYLALPPETQSAIWNSHLVKVEMAKLMLKRAKAQLVT